MRLLQRVRDRAHKVMNGRNHRKSARRGRSSVSGKLADKVRFKAR